ISVEMTFASCALLFLKVFPRSARSWARLWTESLRNDRKLLSARATTFSVCAGAKYENASISSPVVGFTVANPGLFIFAPCCCLSSTIESGAKRYGPIAGWNPAALRAYKCWHVLEDESLAIFVHTCRFHVCVLFLC